MIDPISHKFHRERILASVDQLAGSSGPTAQDFVRSLIARCVSDDPISYAESRWGDSPATRIIKAGIGTTGSGEMLVPGHSARDAFFALVVQESIAGQMTLARRVPFNVLHITPSAGLNGYWIGEKQPVPMSAYALEGARLASRKVGALGILTKESLEDESSIGRVTTDLARAGSGALDEALVGDQAGTDTLPTGLLNGSPLTASVGDPATDLTALIDSFDGDLRTSAVVTDPTTAVALALIGGTAFQGLGARGGVALGLPWITSRSSPRTSDGGQIMLADQAGIALALEGIEVKRSTSATVEADDTPVGEGSGPTGASNNRISLFQLELVGFLATIHANWAKARAGSVAALTGCEYTGS